jgi:2-methylcitrate dehydratase PrpD
VVYTEKMAAFVANTRYEDLKPELVHLAKVTIMDVIGCALSGFSYDRGAISRDVMQGFGGNAESTVMGSNTKTSALNAAYANANMASAPDNEETFMNLSHISAPAACPALAIAERNKSSGKDLITAVAVGYELAARIGISVGFLGKIIDGKVELYSAMGLASWTAMAAVGSVGNLIRLSEDQAVHALGLQAHHAPMPTGRYWRMPSSLTHNKYWDAGWMALGGIISASMSKNGYTSYAQPGILDGEYSFYRMLGAESCDFDAMVDQLGDKWWFMQASFKPWPCCRLIHHPMSAVVSLVKKHELAVEDIRKLTIKGSFMWMQCFHNQSPGNETDAQFSASHSIAMLLLNVPLGDWHRPEQINDPKVIELRQKITIEIDQNIMNQQIASQIARSPRVCTEYPTRVEIEARGQTFGKDITHAMGDPWDEEWKMNDADLTAKFRANAASLLPVSNRWQRRAEGIIDACFNLEKMANVEDLTRLCRPEEC